MIPASPWKRPAREPGAKGGKVPRAGAEEADAAYCRISYCAASWFRSEQKCMRLRGLQLQ